MTKLTFNAALVERSGVATSLVEVLYSVALEHSVIEGLRVDFVSQTRKLEVFLEGHNAILKLPEKLVKA